MKTTLTVVLLLFVAIFAVIAYFCVRGYQKRQLWLALTGYMLGKPSGPSAMIEK